MASDGQTSLAQTDIDSETFERAYALACDLVDRQRRALAVEMPEMNASLHMQPIEAWFLWGVFHDVFDGDEIRAQEMLAFYLHHRRGLPMDRARGFSVEVRQTSTEGNPFFDSVAQGGRHATRNGCDGCFVGAARFVRQSLATCQ